MNSFRAWLMRTDPWNPIVFDTSALSYPNIDEDSITKALSGRVYREKVEKAIALPSRRIFDELGLLNDVLYSFDNNNPVLISEVAHEMDVYAKLIGYYAKFAGKASDELRTRRTPREITGLEKKAELLSELQEAINKVSSKVSGHDPRTCFDQTQTALYERFFEVAASHKRIIDGDISFPEPKEKPSLGRRIQTDCKLVATAATLSFSTDTYLVTRDVNLMRSADYLRNLLKEQDFLLQLPRNPEHSLTIINAADYIKKGAESFSHAAQLQTSHSL